MKKLIAVLLLAVMLCGCGEKEPDFRNINWGMSMDEVRAAEAAEPYEETDDGLLYENIIVDDLINAQLSYCFTDGKLTEAGYFATETVSGDRASDNTYHNLAANISKVYGEPTVSDHELIRMYSKWETKTTVIILFYHEDQAVSISYRDIKVQKENDVSTQ